MTAGPGRPSSIAGAPRGEAQVRASLIAAATELFAERGPSAVTVRQIAEAARVNHGLVHHYFGSKDGLIRAVLDQLAEAAKVEIGAHGHPASIYARGGATERHGRIVAFLLLEGRDLADYKSGFPSMDAVIAQYQRADGVSEDDARLRVAQIVAMVLGWQLFEPFLVAATGLDQTDDLRTTALDDAIERLLRP